MRLIDADAVYKILESCEIRKATIGNPLTDWEYGYTCGIERAESEIECAPTLDAAPVRHGRWIAHTMSEMTGYDPALSGDDPVCTYSCSVCGEECYVSDIGDYILSNYCTNCGARMDEQ